MDRAQQVREGPVDVVVASDQHLVAEAICAALRSRGFHTELVDWEAGTPEPSVPRPRTAEHDSAGRVLLVACDLDLPGRLAETQALGAARGLPWLVVDANAPGPAWGAVLEAGARSVLVSSISLDGLVEALESLAGGSSTMSEIERRALIRQWRHVKGSPDRLLRQMQGLDAADREILAMLYAGTTVHAIADRFGLSESAVRAQVKAVLRQVFTPSSTHET